MGVHEIAKKLRLAFTRRFQGDSIESYNINARNNISSRKSVTKTSIEFHQPPHHMTLNSTRASKWMSHPMKIASLKILTQTYIWYTHVQSNLSFSRGKYMKQYPSK